MAGRGGCWVAGLVCGFREAVGLLPVTLLEAMFREMSRLTAAMLGIAVVNIVLHLYASPRWSDVGAAGEYLLPG